MHEHHYDDQMGITHAEFFRLLPIALQSDNFTQSATGAELDAGERKVSIELGPEAERRIALMVIPITPVHISLNGYTHAEAEAFKARFDQAYQRGGG